MSPTYADGEWLWTLPRDRPLKRGDVVVFRTKDGPVIKRVALLPGDQHLEFKSGFGWIDAFDFRQVRRENPRYRYTIVPPGTIFVLGDHLSTSIDSREYGVIQLSQVERIVEDERAPSRKSDVANRSKRAWMTRDG